GAVDALEALRDDRLDAQQRRALGRPVARRAGSVLLAAQDDQRHALRLVVHARVVDERLRTAGLGEVAGVAALDLLAVVDGLDQRVHQTDVRERAADHDLLIVAAGAEGVEGLPLYAVLLQALGSRRARIDRT